MTFAELLIDCDEGRTLPAVLIGMLGKVAVGPWDSGTPALRLDSTGLGGSS